MVKTFVEYLGRDSTRHCISGYQQKILKSDNILKAFLPLQ